MKVALKQLQKQQGAISHIFSSSKINYLVA
jgi:hypothetical protein